MPFQRRSNTGSDSVAAIEQRAASIEAELGPDHQDTLLALTDLAMAVRDAGDLRRAKNIFELVVSARSRVDGTSAYKTLQAMHRLGAVLHSLGKYDEALVVQQNTLAGFEREHQNNELGIIIARENMVRTLMALKRHREALDSMERALDERVALAGFDDSDTLFAAGVVGDLRRQIGDVEGASALHQRVLDASHRQGADARQRLIVKMNLALELAQLGKLSEGRTLIDDAFAEAQRALPPKDPVTRFIRANRRLLHRRRPRGSLEFAAPEPG